MHKIEIEDAVVPIELQAVNALDPTSIKSIIDVVVDYKTKLDLAELSMTKAGDIYTLSATSTDGGTWTSVFDRSVKTLQIDASGSWGIEGGCVLGLLCGSSGCPLNKFIDKYGITRLESVS